MSKEINKTWAMLAQRLGGEFRERGEGSDIRIILDFSDNKLILDKYVVSTGNSTSYYTRARVFCNGDVAKLSITRRSFMGKVGDIFFGERWMSGDEEFDSKINVRSKDESLYRALENEVLRSEIMLARYPNISLVKSTTQNPFAKGYIKGQHHILYQHPRFEGNEEELMRIIKITTGLYERLKQIGAIKGGFPL